MQRPTKPVDFSYIHRSLFEKGIIVVDAERNDDTWIEKNEFNVNSQIFKLAISKVNSKQGLKKILDLVKGFKGVNLIPDIYIYNTKRREEIFVPFTLCKKQIKYGAYIYPWLSNKKKDYKFSEFNQFVTAGCMLGASLKGILTDNRQVTLINHKLQLNTNQVIHSIHFDESKNIYDAIQFMHLNSLAEFINSLPARQNACVYYHLPYIDYMLFGLKLYISKNMTYSALDKLCKLMLYKRIEHIDKINAIFKSKGLTVLVESPFENIMKCVSNPEDIAKTLLALFKIHPSEICQEISELDVVRICTNLLIKNKIQSHHQAVWNDFLDTVGQESIHTFEDLFRIANTVMHGVACAKSSDYQTCALLPLTEKQIQVEFSKVNQKIKIPYPEIFNITILDPVIPYSSNTKGVLFYLEKDLPSLRDGRLLSLGYENLTLFSKRTTELHEHQLQNSVETSKNIDDLSSMIQSPR